MFHCVVTPYPASFGWPISLHCGCPPLLSRWEWWEEGKAGNVLARQQTCTKAEEAGMAQLLPWPVVEVCIAQVDRIDSPAQLCPKTIRLKMMKKLKAEMLNKQISLKWFWSWRMTSHSFSFIFFFFFFSFIFFSWRLITLQILIFTISLY